MTGASDGAGDGLRRVRALLLSFAMSYYLGLNSEQRKFFVTRVTERYFSLDLPEVLEEEMSYYMRHVDPGPGIAFTRGLKENVFAIIVGVLVL